MFEARPAQPGHVPQYQIDTTGPHILKIFRFCFESRVWLGVSVTHGEE